MNGAKPSVFLGSSREGEDVARAFETHLVGVAETTLWSAGIFGLTQNTLESLVNALDRFDFAVLVVTGDDLVISRDKASWRGRDNVMFEMGLFMGRLGRPRTFILCDPRSVTLPSDLAGVTVAAYDSSRADGNLQAAVSPAATQVRDAVRKLDVFEGRTAKRLGEATTDVEQITEIVSRLVYLLARSRAVELDVLSTQFAPVLSKQHLEKMKEDLQELEQATGASEDILDKRARGKLLDFFGGGMERIHESFMLHNNCSDVVIGRMIANNWVIRDEDFVQITEIGRAVARQWQDRATS